MDHHRYERLLNATLGKPGRLRESYMSRNHPGLLAEINEYSAGDDLPFPQRVWHWAQAVKKRPLCTCGKPTTFNKNWLEGYRPYCSSACSLRSDQTKDKRKATIIEKYGVDNVAKNEQIKARTKETNLERYGHESSASGHSSATKTGANGTAGQGNKGGNGSSGTSYSRT